MKLVNFEKCGHTEKVSPAKVLKVFTDPSKPAFVCPRCSKPSKRWSAKNA